MSLLSAVGLALTIAGPAEPQAPATAASVSAAPSAAALRIAVFLASEDIVLAQSRRVLHQQLPSVLKADADIRIMEEKWPGITAEFIGVMEPIIVSSLSRRLPAYQREVASVFDKRMSPTELATTYAFYDSPTGRHVLMLVREGVDFSTLLKQQIAAEGDTSVSSADLGTALTSALTPALAQISGSEQLQMVSFAMTSAGRKINAVNHELLEIAARFNNDKDAQSDAAIDIAVKALIERRMATGKKH